MELSQFPIQALVEEIKEGMFQDIDAYSLVSPSAYDTAWLAMIPDSNQPFQPMFKDSLNWVLRNQREVGCWGVCDGHGSPTVESLPATLACIIVLKRWNAGRSEIDKGLDFVRANAGRLLGENHGRHPGWFVITFSAMVELAHAEGLEIVFPESLTSAMRDIFYQRQQIFENEELVGKYRYPPLLAYLEALPPSYDINQEQIVKNLSDDGSLFQSPSATARAFMATGNRNCLAYLKYLVRTFANNGVPPTYPIDEDLTKLCMVHQLQRLGLAEHFDREIEQVLGQVYRSYKNGESSEKPISPIPMQLYKDSLAFQLLRMHGYSVSPRTFCWFLHSQEIKDQIEEDNEHFSSVMLNVLRATDLMFPEEHEVEEARSFARKSLEKTISTAANIGQDNCPILSFQRVIQHELEKPWFTRLEHLEHRRWIEENDSNALWMGKTSFHRLACSHNEKLMQLAARNYEFRQLVYRNELEELKRWSKDSGLIDMGFGREKTTYCYFAVAASINLSSPYDSYIRLLVAKSAIIITVADDLFDMGGYSLDELKILTDAVKRWDVKGLNGHSKTIFDALDNLVRGAAAKYFQQEGSNITNELQDIWYETFASWFTEAKWSISGHIPSMDKYIETGMISIAAHTLLLKASCFLNPSLPNNKLRPAQYETLTKLVMVVTRLLNDLQSYQKELEDGKTNFVLLYLKENPKADIEDSIAYIKEVLATMKKQLLEHALMDGLSDLPKPCKLLHLSCMKVFQMFFNSSNRYDSDTAMLQDIQKAIYIPLKVQITKPLKPALPFPIPLPVPFYSKSKKEYKTTINSRLYSSSIKHYNKSLVAQAPSMPPISRNAYKNMVVPPKFGILSFI